MTEALNKGGASISDERIKELYVEHFRYPLLSCNEEPLLAFARSLLSHSLDERGAQTASPVVTMRPMEFDDGRKGWYVDHPEFYADIEPDRDTGNWSVFFRDKQGKEGFAERVAGASSEGAATPLHPNHLPDLRYVLGTLQRTIGHVPEDLEQAVRAAVNGMRYIIKRTEEAKPPASDSAAGAQEPKNG